MFMCFNKSLKKLRSVFRFRHLEGRSGKGKGIFNRKRMAFKASRETHVR